MEYEENETQTKNYKHLMKLEKKAEIELQRVGLNKTDVMNMLGNAFKTSSAEFQILGFDVQTNTLRYKNRLNSVDSIHLDELVVYGK